jgi:hypothetical protein
MIPSPREEQADDFSETEGARSATGVSENQTRPRPGLVEHVPNPEVPAKA